VPGEIGMARGMSGFGTSAGWGWLLGLLLAAGGLAVTASEAWGQSTHHARYAAAKPAEPPAQPLITLERSACHGQCAEYRLSFFEDGQVVYDGLANVSKAGRWYAHVPRETIEQLLVEFRRVGYDSLSPKYPPGLDQSPIATTSLRTAGKTKVVTHQVSSPFPPPALSVLEDRVDASVQSVVWGR